MVIPRPTTGSVSAVRVRPLPARWSSSGQVSGHGIGEASDQSGGGGLRDGDPPEVQGLVSGSDVALPENDAELTPSQVAQHLSMSRTHLYKKLDPGELASHTVGRDRRIRFADVAAFELRRQQSGRQLAERFAHSDASRAGAIDEIADEL